jgi:photosystem II stability/assembly factor-like uncharacterized protein
MKSSFQVLTVLIFLQVNLCMGQNWYPINPHTSWDVTSVSFVDNLNGYIGGGIWSGPFGLNYTFLKRTTNGGQTFTTVFDSSGDTPLCQLHFFTMQRGIFRRWQDIIQKTLDGGVNEFTILNYSIASGGSRFQVLDSLHIFYFGDGLNQIYYTSDGAQSWIQYNTLSNSGNVGSFFNADTGFYSPQNSMLYLTFDAGVTWTNVLSGYPVLGLQCLNDSVVLLFSPNEILRSTDFGTTWNSVFTSAQNVTRCDVKDNLVVVCGTGGLVAKSHDNGATWISDYPPTTETLEDICITDTFHEGWYVVGHNNKMYRHYDFTADIEKSKDDKSLTCIPNPSSGTFEIQTNLNVQSIEIFNLMGEIIYSENYSNGPFLFSKTIKLNVDPGIYFLEVKGDEKSLVRKVIIN